MAGRSTRGAMEAAGGLGSPGTLSHQIRIFLSAATLVIVPDVARPHT